MRVVSAWQGKNQLDWKFKTEAESKLTRNEAASKIAKAWARHSGKIKILKDNTLSSDKVKKGGQFAKHKKMRFSKKQAKEGSKSRLALSKMRHQGDNQGELADLNRDMRS